MRVPLEWLREYCDPPLDTAGVASRLTMTGTKVEAILRQSADTSDIDVLVILRDPDMGRLATMAERLSARVGREIQLVRLSDAEASPILMDEILKHGRVLIDRDAHWPRLQATAERWRRRARRAEESLLAAATEHSFDRSTA